MPARGLGQEGRLDVPESIQIANARPKPSQIVPKRTERAEIDQMRTVCVEDQIRLLVLQQQLEQEAAASGRPFVGLSINATIRQIVPKRTERAEIDQMRTVCRGP
jgi:hypothetical protein